MNKCYKMIGIITRLSVNLIHDTISRIYKSLLHLIWIAQTIIYDKPDSESFKNKTENVWYKACIATQRTSLVLLKEHLEITYTMNWAWNLSELTFFYKIANGFPPEYLTTNYLNNNDSPFYKSIRT